MIPMNQYPASSVVPITFTTYGKTNGESITLTGLAVTDIEIYKGTSMTQRASDAGYALLDTDGIDIDGITGFHGFSVDLGDNTDAGFFAVGSFYTVVVSAVTIDGQTVNFIADRFRITPAEGITGHPKVDVGGWLGTAAAAPTVAGVPEVDVTHLLGTAWLAPGVAGTPDVNMLQISGDATAADNLEKEYDGTGYGSVLVRTTIATLASQVSFTLTAGSADNDAYNGCIIVVEDASTAAQKAVGIVSDYTGASKTIALLADPAVFTMATTDIVTIIADKSLKPTVPNRTLVVDADGLADANVVKAGPTGAGVAVSAWSATRGLAGTALPAAAANAAGGLPVSIVGGLDLDAKVGALTYTVAGKVDANATHLSGDATAADNAEAFFDGTGYAGTNNVIPSVTTVTGNVNGSVASVTGAVGSVTGAVGSVTGAVGSVTGAVGSVTGAVGSVSGNVTGSVGSLATQAKADVNAEVVDVLNTDTGTEVTVPAAAAALREQVQYLYQGLRNKIDVTATAKEMHNSAGAVTSTKVLTDDGSTYSEAKAT